MALSQASGLDMSPCTKTTGILPGSYGSRRKIPVLPLYSEGKSTPMAPSRFRFATWN